MTRILMTIRSLDGFKSREKQTAGGFIVSLEVSKVRWIEKYTESVRFLVGAGMERLCFDAMA